MDYSPLQDIEESAHDQFPGPNPPDEHALAGYIQEKLPKMDGGASVAIALAALVIAGWEAVQNHRARRTKNGGPIGCPKGGHPPIVRTEDGKLVCAEGHVW